MTRASRLTASSAGSEVLRPELVCPMPPGNLLLSHFDGKNVGNTSTRTSRTPNLLDVLMNVEGSA